MDKRSHSQKRPHSREHEQNRNKPRQHSASGTDPRDRYRSQQSINKSKRSRSVEERSRVFSGFHPMGGIEREDTGVVKGPFSGTEDTIMNSKLYQMEVHRRLSHAKDDMISTWVAPKIIQSAKYKNYVIPVLPRIALPLTNKI